MAKLPEELGPSAWIGRNLEQVCFAAYQADLWFDPRMYVRLTDAGLRITKPSGEVVEFENPQRAFALVDFVEHVVRDAECAPDGTVCLTFDDGSVLELLADHPVESYFVKVDGKEFFV